MAMLTLPVGQAYSRDSQALVVADKGFCIGTTGSPGGSDYAQFPCLQEQITTVTAAQLATLGTTGVAVVSALGAGLVAVPLYAQIYQAAQNTGATLAGANDYLKFTYTSIAGAEALGRVTANGLLTATTAQIRTVFGKTVEINSTAHSVDITPVANAAVVVGLSANEAVAQSGTLVIKIVYSVMSSTLAG